MYPQSKTNYNQIKAHIKTTESILCWSAIPEHKACAGVAEYIFTFLLLSSTFDNCANIIESLCCIKHCTNP